MIERKDVMPINYYKKEPFTGSDAGMRYMIRKKESEVSDGEKKNEDGSPVMKKVTELEVIRWPQPFCFEKTPDEQKKSAFFSFDEAGIQNALDWLNLEHQNEEEEFFKAEERKSYLKKKLQE